MSASTNLIDIKVPDIGDFDGVADFDQQFNDGYFSEIANIGHFDVYICHVVVSLNYLMNEVISF